MIKAQRQLFYFVGDKPYASLAEAQKADLIALMPATDNPVGLSNDGVADWMLENAAAIVDTLTTTPNSRLKARKFHGAKRAKPEKKTKPLSEGAKATA